MARISRDPTYQSSKQLAPGSAPNVRLSSAVGSALKGVGSALGGLADAALARQNDKENFQATNDYNALKMNLNQDMQDQYDNHEGDGEDYSSTFIDTSYRTRKDAFLQNLPDRLKEKYGTLLSDDDEQPGSDYTTYSNKAARNESALRQNWYKRSIEQNEEDLQTAIHSDPDNFDEYRKQGRELIEQSGLLPTDKEAALRQWDQKAAGAFLDRELEDNPHGVLRKLGVDPRTVSPPAKRQMLYDAIMFQESRGDPRAESPKGASGNMQVMPNTAREIAAELGDKAFPTKGNDAEVKEYLKNPTNGERYGRHYIDKMLAKYGGDVEAALVAYNGGPKRADNWIKAGRDDSVLPKETSNYYKEIMQRMDPYGEAKRKPAATKGKSKIVFTGGPERPKPPAKPVMDTMQSVSDTALGKGFTITIYSGTGDHGSDRHRDVHGMGGGIAGDITITAPNGKPASYKQMESFAREWRNQTGGGVGWGPEYMGADRMHVDLKTKDMLNPGQGMAWGSYAKALDLGNGAPGDPRFSALDYSTRQKYRHAAEKSVGQTSASSKAAAAVAKVNIRRDMANELAVYTATGEGTAGFDEAQILRTLGESDYAKFSDKRDTAIKTHTATSGIGIMSYDDMQQRLEDYALDPSSDSFSSDQKVRTAVEKEIERITRMRARDPATATMEFPDVKKAKEEIDAQMETDPKAVDPESVRALVDMMLARQKLFDIPPSARAPVPRQWAMGIGQAMARVPDIGGDTKLAEVRNAVAVQYQELEKMFGDQTDEVILYALSVYNGMETETADLVTSYMKAIANGGDPLKLRSPEAALQVEQESLGMLDSISNWLFDDNEEGGDQPAASPEVLRRTVEELRSASTPEEIERIRARRGDAAVTTAQQQLGK